ncbi:MAG: SMC family ATPase [Thermodesulfobacterium sp.]|nr:SMC family ATPase [Thermodesulfobacterium sp.]
MKPLYLSIKGFGPYLQVEIGEEDFKFLVENKLFLISGEIGAGKTTLFDAIVYALYGESTVEGRNPADLISHFIKNKPNIIPEINFKFSLDGKIYQIIRRPPLGRRTESVSLWIENRLFSSKKGEIKNKIKELIGLDAKQFKKVFLIPQGEYRKILLAKKEEREALLETIFETSLFSHLEDFLKIKLKKIKELYQSLSKREEDLKNIAQISDLEELKNKIKELKNKQKSLAEKLKLLFYKKEKIEKEIKELENISQLYKEIKDLSEKLKNLKSEEEKIQAKKELLKKLKVLKDHQIFYENFEKLKKELKDNHYKKKKLSNTLFKIQNDLKTLEEETKNLLQYEKDIEEKKQELKSLKDLENRFIERVKLQKRLKEIIYLLQKRSEELKNLQDRIKLVKEETEKSFEKKDKVNKALILIKEREKIVELFNNFEEYERLIPELKRSEKKIKELIEHCEKLEKVKEDLEIKNRAQYLAKFLKKGEPCPVCGSTFHPSPIKEKNFFKNLKLVEKEISEKKELLEKEKEKFYTLKAKIKRVEDILQNQDKNELRKKYKKIEEELLQLPKNYLSNLSEDKVKNLNTFLENKIKDLKTQLNFLEKKELKVKEEIEKLKNEEISIKERLRVFQELFINFSSFEDLKFKIEALQREIEVWENRKKTLENKFLFLREEKIKIESELKNTEKILKEKSTEYKKNVLKLIDLKVNGFITSINDFKNYITVIPQIENIEKEIQSYFYEVEIIQRKLEENNKKLEICKKNWEKVINKSLNEDTLTQKLESMYREKGILEESLGKINKDIGSLERDILHLQEILITYEKIKEEKKGLEKEYPLLETLYNIIVGKNKKGVSFHSFVLSLFAQLILKRANFYLKDFSFGRYKFIEDEILQKKFTLEVFDHYTGSKRETKTLSGGESFLATLSLALGTSDVILNLYRTRPFESLFIDEGFGSLDENSLEKVVNTLLNLAHQSGRIIGIISHLKDLKEKFPAVVEVYKNQFSGSYIKINKNL